MSRHLVFLALALCFVVTPVTRSDAHTSVGVDDRVELLTIVARLAGSAEFAMDNSRSPYADRVTAHFGAAREHPAIRAYAELRRKHGASFDALPSLALHLDRVPTLAERIPFDQHPKRLDERWLLEPTRDFLVKLRDFASVTKAAEFFTAEREFYAKVDVRLGAFVTEANSVPWFDAFLGAKAGATYVVIPGLLCGGGNFGVGVVFNDGTPEELRPVLGCWSWDADGIPVFAQDTYLPTYVHELCHSYTNPVIDRHLAELEPAANRMYPAVDRVMRRMAYTTGKIVLYESLVRACVIRYLADVKGAEAAAREAQAQVGAGFTWVPDLATLFDRYAKDRARYPTLDAFVPEIDRFFDERANTLVRAAEVAKALAPRLVSMTPRNGANDVDPALDTLTLTFDRPMKPGAWSFVGAKNDIPEMLGKPTYDSAGTVLSVKIRLKPGFTYRFSLNSEKFRGFAGSDGTPLEPVDVTFSVRGF